MRVWLTYLFVLANMAFSFAQTGGVTVQATLDRDSILIGEQIGLSLSVSGPSGTINNIKWPAYRDTFSKNIEIISVDSVPDTMRTAATTTLNLDYIITSWDSGTFAIPPLVVTWENGNAASDVLLLYSNTVYVDTTLAIKDIKEIYELDRTFWEWCADNWLTLTIIGIVVVIGLFLWWFFTRKKEEPEIVSAPAAPLPLHLATIKELEALDEQQLWQKGQYKAYYVGLTDILRAYIEKRYNLTAFEKTTDELTENLRFSDMEESARMQLKSILVVADLVKFAKEKPMDSENKRALQESIRLVDRTRPLHTPEMNPTQ